MFFFFFLRISIIYNKDLRRKILQYRSYMFITEDVARSVTNKVSVGDWWVLYMLGKNMDPVIYREVMLEIAKKVDNWPGTRRRLPNAKRIWKPYNLYMYTYMYPYLAMFFFFIQCPIRVFHFFCLLKLYIYIFFFVHITHNRKKRKGKNLFVLSPMKFQSVMVASRMTFFFHALFP